VSAQRPTCNKHYFLPHNPYVFLFLVNLLVVTHVPAISFWLPGAVNAEHASRWRAAAQSLHP
jgi:hypothetical protein